MGLSVITIGYKNIEDIVKTLNSVDKCEKPPHEHILIISGLKVTDRLNLENQFKMDYRRFFFDIDSGIYNAMNIGIRHATGTHCLFLNSGDSFYSTKAISMIENSLEFNHCQIYSSIICYEDMCFVRPARKKTFFGQQDSFAHQAFVGVLEKDWNDRIYYNESYGLAADHFWMTKMSSLYNISEYTETLVIFELDGVSSTPSLKAIKKRLQGRQYLSSFLVSIKYVLYLILGVSLYFKFVAWKNNYEKH